MNTIFGGMDPISGPQEILGHLLGKNSPSHAFLVFPTWPNKYFVSFSHNVQCMRLNLDKKDQQEILFWSFPRFEYYFRSYPKMASIFGHFQDFNSRFA